MDVFAGQGKHSGFDYHMDKGQGMDAELDMNFIGFRNAPIQLSQDTISQQVRSQQLRYVLKPSENLSIQKVDGRPSYNLTIEMETGTGKTYTYIRTLMELNKQYGWLKFIIVVPSIAIREGCSSPLRLWQTISRWSTARNHATLSMTLAVWES